MSGLQGFGDSHARPFGLRVRDIDLSDLKWCILADFTDRYSSQKGFMPCECSVLSPPDCVATY